jgi:hypothetical protein
MVGGLLTITLRTQRNLKNFVNMRTSRFYKREDFSHQFLIAFHAVKDDLAQTPSLHVLALSISQLIYVGSFCFHSRHEANIEHDSKLKLSKTRSHVRCANNNRQGLIWIDVVPTLGPHLSASWRGELWQDMQEGFNRSHFPSLTIISEPSSRRETRKTHNLQSLQVHASHRKPILALQSYVKRDFHNGTPPVLH